MKIKFVGTAVCTFALTTSITISAPAAASALVATNIEIAPGTLYKDSIIEPRVAWLSDTEFVAVWGQPVGTTERPRWDIIMRRFDASGNPVTDPVLVTDSVSTFILDTSLYIRALEGGHFVLAWVDESFELGTQYDIYAQVFDPMGKARSLRFPVPATFDRNQVHVAIMPVTGNRFAALYRSNQMGADNNDIFAQRFDYSGTRVGSAVRLNSTTTGFQSRPAGDCNASGRCLVTWDTVDVSTPISIRGQFMSSNLVFNGSEFEVLSVTDGDALLSDVAMGADGHSVVTMFTQPRFEGGAPFSLHFARYRGNNTLRSGPTLVTSQLPGSSASALIHSSGNFGFGYSAETATRSRAFVRDYLAGGGAVSTIPVADVPLSQSYLRGTHADTNSAGRTAVVWIQYPLSEINFEAVIRGAVLNNFGTSPAASSAPATEEAAAPGTAPPTYRILVK
jgi:hypothetical protein